MFDRKRCRPALVLTAFSAIPPAAGQPPNLSDELAAPFSYILPSSDVVGFKDCPEGFQLLRDGTLLSSFGQFTVTAGDLPRAFDARIRTLHRGYLPILEYRVQRDGVSYEFRTWGAPARLEPRENLVAFIHVTMKNEGTSAARAGLFARFGRIEGPGRNAFACTAWYRDRFMNVATFEKDVAVKVSKGEAMRGEHVVFAFDGAPATDNDSVSYHFDLVPAQEQTVAFKVPYVPIALDRTDALRVFRDAESAESLRTIVRFWDDLLASATRIELPEPKVVDTVRASLVYDLIARDVDETGKAFVQKVNEFQYDDFYPRDASYIIRAYDMYGLHQIAEQTLQSYLVRGKAGTVERLRRFPNHPDDWGQSIATLGTHFRMTADTRFARDVLPGIAPHLDDFESATRGDPQGLWPVAPPYDNELINGHYTGHNFWAVLGLREARNLALAAGDVPLAERCGRLLDAFVPVLMRHLEKMTSQTEGYIPPGLDDPNAGFDWENATGGVYPFGVLSPDHAWVGATVDTVREYKWREGISTWGPNAWLIKQKTWQGLDANPGWLHHYQTFNVVQTLLAMGRQRDVIEDLYSILAHTSSTHAGFEMGMNSWQDRDPDGNFAPHGWFAARYCELMRNMLVREEGATLHLASALSPRWLRPGDVVRVTNAATHFGPVSFSLAARDDGATVSLDARWRAPPERVLLHVPWFVTLESAVTDAGPARSENDSVVLPPSMKTCTLKWHWNERPDLSYDRAVHLWLTKNYSPQPQTDLLFLFPRPTRPKLADARRIFTDSFVVQLLSPARDGEIRYTLDASAPTRESPRYDQPFSIRETTAVRAIEIWPDGRVSEPLAAKITKVAYREPERSANLEPGLTIRVHHGAFDKLPDFATLKPDATTTAASLDLAAVGREHEYAVRFTGFFKAPLDGIYRFTLGSDDGSRLSIGDQIVADNDGLHTYMEVGGEAALRAGMHPLIVDYFERGGAAHLRVFCEGPDWPRQPVGRDALWRIP